MGAKLFSPGHVTVVNSGGVFQWDNAGTCFSPRCGKSGGRVSNMVTEDRGRIPVNLQRARSVHRLWQREGIKPAAAFCALMSFLLAAFVIIAALSPRTIVSGGCAFYGISSQRFSFSDACKQSHRFVALWRRVIILAKFLPTTSLRQRRVSWHRTLFAGGQFRAMSHNAFRFNWNII